MKKIIAVLLALLILMTVFAGCGNKNKDDGKISIVCTIFPQYDWVRQILGDSADSFKLTLLLNNKIDLHNYQPSVNDIVTISDCDLFIYIGGESDEWVDDVLKNAKNEDMVVINLLEELGSDAMEEELLEGMEEDDHDHGEEDNHDDDDEHEHEYDEHIWLSLKNAEKLCSVITKAINDLDSENSEDYNNNLSEYKVKLNALDLQYQTEISAASVKTVLFGDRFPFRYLIDNYGLSAYAAFSGCSTETEASFDTVIFLAEKVNELGLKAILVTESSDKSVANTILNNTTAKNQKIIVLDSMQSITTADVENGTTYLSIMQNNLTALMDALK